MNRKTTRTSLLNENIFVCKYGGSSVSTVEKILNIADQLIFLTEKGHQVVVVVSAMGKSTDQLCYLASQITKSPSERELDMLLSTGEQVTISLLSMAIQSKGKKSKSLTGSQVGIRTDGRYNRACITSIPTDVIRKNLDEGSIVIVAGFQGVGVENEITTLGRGGSDLTALALATALNVNQCHIYTDVDGIYSADPSVIPQARHISELSCEEMLELSSLGARVMHSRSIEIAEKNNIEVHVTHAFKKGRKTIIKKEVNEMESVLVTGIVVNNDEAKITIEDVVDQPGIAALIFQNLAEKDINIDIIIQNVSREGKTSISFTINQSDLRRCLKVCEDLRDHIHFGKIREQSHVSKISVVGVGMRRQTGVAAQMFKCLADIGVNIEMITTSEIRISCLIDQQHANKVAQALHTLFKIDEELK